jgi:hypothetical protein
MTIALFRSETISQIVLYPPIETIRSAAEISPSRSLLKSRKLVSGSSLALRRNSSRCEAGISGPLTMSVFRFVQSFSGSHGQRQKAVVDHPIAVLSATRRH